ncbi:MAG TPA: hypothetical protein VFS21_19820 [Roseiflexaceae bacterium]|nr:hypothetical protein [Roseiflexaceae bacterium]
MHNQLGGIPLWAWAAMAGAGTGFGFLVGEGIVAGNFHYVGGLIIGFTLPLLALYLVFRWRSKE